MLSMCVLAEIQDKRSKREEKQTMLNSVAHTKQCIPPNSLESLSDNGLHNWCKTPLSTYSIYGMDGRSALLHVLKHYRNEWWLGFKKKKNNKQKPLIPNSAMMKNLLSWNGWVGQGNFQCRLWPEDKSLTRLLCIEKTSPNTNSQCIDISDTIRMHLSLLDTLCFCSTLQNCEHDKLRTQCDAFNQQQAKLWTLFSPLRRYLYPNFVDEMYWQRLEH